MLKSRTIVFFAATLFYSGFSNCQENTASSDAKWVINKSIEATGGESLLRSVNTLYTEMSTQMYGRPVTWVTKEMSPNKGAFQIIYKDQVVYEDWFNGKQGFELVNGEKKESDPATLEDKFPRKHIFNELDYLDTSIYKVHLLADQKVNGKDCYKVRAIFVLGNERLLYIDKKSFQTIKEERVRKGETEITSTTYFANFKKYGKIIFYSTLILGDGPDAQKATLKKFLVNEGIGEIDFSK